jgi:hypothetical protein
MPPQKIRSTNEEIFNILVHKGNANQMTLRFHLTPVKMAVINNTTKNAGEDVVGM